MNGMDDYIEPTMHDTHVIASERANQHSACEL